ncbi:RND family efflux transporter MFP subunit [Lacibacter cauensis]|uniref:RND family efflux transporter MFP subunit n=1 Tax=Lacibacter cauensis TaxID=510947 RepID=A0A562S8C9_9BACT|nr:efflux RND transporter periplasmic adaptor subunit [Lacibacter cauensis]TWI77691.1 RND family efflux transporter MFP subunit [Lacibacter cauensis]
MKRIIILLLLSLPVMAFAHGGEDHGDAKKTIAASTSYFSAEAFSDKYELLLRYNPITPGKETVLKLFISEFDTNKPIDSATLNITVSGNPNLKVVVSRIEKGIYELKTTFPEKKAYSLVVSINSYAGIDLIQLNNIETGKELTVAATENTAHTHWYSSNWFFGLIGLLIGLIVMFFINKTRSRKIIATAIILFCLLPTATYNSVSAHDGHDEAGAKKSGGSSTIFMVEKETQFLFNIQTQKIGTGDFNGSSVLLGTVTAAPQGRAVIQSPQAGKIVSLRVTPGQRVGKGQVVAVIEQQVDAGTQISIISQSNSVNAEYEAAKAQYERLKAIEDIAAKKDITEAKARYESAKRNKALFDANTGRNTGNTKAITLTSPVSGVVGTFNYAIGAVVSGGETLFEITNLDQVFVEAQVFATDAEKLKSATGFTTISNADTLVYKLKMISTAQSVNSGNQSQKVVFELINPKGQFKIGENVNVRMTGSNVIRQVVIPNEAITDVNGKPAIFIKDKAEQFSISFVVKGQSNDKFTVITKGTEDGERIVTANVYQMKMMYLNQ